MNRALLRLLAAACLVLASLPVQAGAIQPPATIRAAAARFLRAQHPGATPAMLHVHVDALDPRLRLPRCAAGALHTFLAPGSRAAGNTTVGLRCARPHLWTLYVPARVSLYRKVLVAAQPLPRGTRLNGSDVRLARRDVAQLGYGYFTAPRDAEGKLLRRLVPAGMAISPQMLQSPALVRRGQEVVLLAETAGLQVRMNGQALSGGAAGDHIKVRNLSSHRIVEGVIVSAGVVQVPL